MTITLLGVACGGSGSDYSPREQEAIRQAEQLLESGLGTQASGVSEVALDGDLWRVELETGEGYRCVYMTSELEAESEAFELLTVKSGSGCAGDLLYNASDGGIQHPGIDGATANALHDAAYKTCYGSALISPKTVGAVAAKRNPAYRDPSEDGCRDANLDIEACVPPIYYDGVSPYYCDDGTGRYLKSP